MHRHEQGGGRLADPGHADEDDVGLVVALEPNAVIRGEREVDGVEPCLILRQVAYPVVRPDGGRRLPFEVGRQLIDEVVEESEHERAAVRSRSRISGSVTVEKTIGWSPAAMRAAISAATSSIRSALLTKLRTTYRTGTSSKRPSGCGRTPLR